MDPMAMTSSTEHLVPCPQDGRRSLSEFYVKFFAVSLSTLVFYFRAIQKQERSLLSLNPLLFSVAPFAFIAKYATALLAIIMAILFHVVRIVSKGQAPEFDTIVNSLRWLFGKAPEKEPGYTPVQSSANTTSGEERRSSSCNRILWILGEVLVILVFLVQCCGSIVLYSRRRQRDGVTLFDQRTFELACSGVLIGAIALFQALHFPVFAGGVPTGPPKTGLDCFVLFCRDSGQPSLSPFSMPPDSESLRRWVRILKNLTFSATVFAVQFSDLAIVFTSSDVREYFASMWAFQIPLFTLVAYMFLLIFKVHLGTRLKTGHWGPLRWRFSIWPASTNLVARLVLTLFLAAGIGGVAYVLYFIWVWIVGWLWMFAMLSWPGVYVFASAQISRLQLAPEDQPCPLLWSDPWSQYILNVA